MSDPKTFDEAVQWVIDLIKPDDLAEIRTLLKTRSAEDVAGMSHHGFGTYVRNHMHLWEESTADLRQSVWNTLTPEKQKFYRDWWKGAHQGRTMHADDASHTLLVAALKKIKGDA